MTGLSFPQVGVGLVHGIDDVFRVDWMEPDLALMVDPVDGAVISEFASSRPGGFINQNDVLDQASDLLAEWDADNL